MENSFIENLFAIVLLILFILGQKYKMYTQTNSAINKLLSALGFTMETNFQQ
jgi:putative effector of murein hydrolase